MTTLKQLKEALEGFDENLDVKIVMRPIHIGETVDGHEAGDFHTEQKTYVEVTYYYPLIRKPEKHEGQTNKAHVSGRHHMGGNR
jgi:hypothetical protein